MNSYSRCVASPFLMINDTKGEKELKINKAIINLLTTLQEKSSEKYNENHYKICVSIFISRLENNYLAQVTAQTLGLNVIRI